MNANQRQSILDAIVEFEKADFETPFKNKYKDTATFDSIVIADYSIDELFAMAKRAIVQLKEFLDNGNWQVVPSDNIPMPIYGNITLRNVIVSFTNSFKSAAYEQAATQVKSLVYFEMRCGFWVQPKRVELGIREYSLKTLEQRAELTMSHIDARENKVKLLIDELELKKLEIEKLINTKRQELEALKNNQSESNVILEKVNIALENERPIKTYSREERNDTSKLYFFSKKIKQDLAYFDIIPNKTYCSVNFVKNIPNKYFIDFIRGFFDGDGCITKCNSTLRWQIDGASLETFKEIQNRMLNYGIELKITKEPDKRSTIQKYRLYIYSKNKCREIFNLLYQNNNELRMKRKYEKFLKLIDE